MLKYTKYSALKHYGPAAILSTITHMMILDKIRLPHHILSQPVVSVSSKSSVKSLGLLHTAGAQLD